MPPTEANGQAPAPQPAPPPNPFDALWDATRKAHFYGEALKENTQVGLAAGLDVAELMLAGQVDLVVDGERVFLLVPSVGGGPPFVRVKQGVYLHTLDHLVRLQAERRARPEPAHQDGAHACCDPRLPEPDGEALDEAAWHAATQDVARIERHAHAALDRALLGVSQAPGALPADDGPEGDPDRPVPTARSLRGLDARIARDTATAR